MKRSPRRKVATIVDSDEAPTVEDSDDAEWIAAQRQIVVDYLAGQRIEHDGVSLEPRWFLSPYLAVWAVRSRANPDRVGWWAISGDVPTDYIACSGERDSGDVLIAFSRVWKAAAKKMAAGEQLVNCIIGAGDPTRAKNSPRCFSHAPRCWKKSSQGSKAASLVGRVEQPPKLTRGAGAGCLICHRTRIQRSRPSRKSLVASSPDCTTVSCSKLVRARLEEMPRFTTHYPSENCSSRSLTTRINYSVRFFRSAVRTSSRNFG